MADLTKKEKELDSLKIENQKALDEKRIAEQKVTEYIGRIKVLQDKQETDKNKSSSSWGGFLSISGGGALKEAHEKL